MARIWVDADACPGEVKKILFRAAPKREVRVTLVANAQMWTPRSQWVDLIAVPTGIDEADRRIVELVEPGDLVVTSDIPLAAEVVAKDAVALSPRGELHTADNVQDRLATRDMLDQLRESGHVTGGPSSFSDKDKQAFANQLDRWLTRRA